MTHPQTLHCVREDYAALVEIAFDLAAELATAKRELRHTRARLAFTEKLEHQQFKEKRAALAVLSEIKELLSEGGEQ